MVKPPRSAYVHIPFCHKRCFYCDFSIIPLGDSAETPGSPGITSINAYLDLLHREISIAPKGPVLSTIYFGGGTPSLLNKNEVGDLLQNFDWVNFVTDPFFILFLLLPVIIKLVPKHIKQKILSKVKQHEDSNRGYKNDDDV